MHRSRWSASIDEGTVSAENMTAVNRASEATPEKVQVCDDSAADHCLIKPDHKTADSRPKHRRAALEDLCKRYHSSRSFHMSYCAASIPKRSIRPKGLLPICASNSKGNCVVTSRPIEQIRLNRENLVNCIFAGYSFPRA